MDKFSKEAFEFVQSNKYNLATLLILSLITVSKYLFISIIKFLLHSLKKLSYVLLSQNLFKITLISPY